MSWKNIRLIFLREVRDQLRDRRTLFMITILPVLLYPMLGLGLVEMMLTFSEQRRTVVILNADQLPESPALLNADGIVAEWYADGQKDADRLRVITDRSWAGPATAAAAVTSAPHTVTGAPHTATDAPLTATDAPLTATDNGLRPGERPAAQLLTAARELSSLVRQLQQQEDAAQADLPTDTHSSAERQRRQSLPAARNLAARHPEISRLQSEINRQLELSGIQVLLLVPDGYQAALQTLQQQITSRSADDPAATPDPILVVRNSADDKSVVAAARVRDALQRWEDDLRASSFTAAALPEALQHPARLRWIEVAREEQVSASVWSKLFPAMLVIMALTGAFYPAIDLGAGEKERGTMETLLISPAKRVELVLGKFGTVLVFSIGTALLNLLSLGLTGQHIAGAMGGGQPGTVSLDFPGFAALAWLLILLVPLAALFSALCLALATFARSTKEGQYYLTPLLMVVMGLTMFCLSPAVEMTPLYSVLPVLNVALLLKGLLLTSAQSSSLMVYAIPVLISSIGYSMLALWWAIELYNSEDVLFREAEKLDLRLWLKQLLRTKDAVPAFPEAVFCFIVILLLQFVAMSSLQPDLTSANAGQDMLRIMVIQQLVMIACPAVFMGVLLTTSLRATFRLRRPSPTALLLGIGLAVVAHPLSVELSQFLVRHQVFPPLPPGAAQVLQLLRSDEQPVWLLLVVFGLTPAICEELAFRGFILSGLARGGRLAIAVVISSLFFGIIHMIPQQAFNAALLGLVLGLLAIYSRSLFPAMAFHLVNNVLATLHAGGLSWIVADEVFLSRDAEHSLRYEAPLLILCAVAGFLMVLHMIRIVIRDQDRRRRGLVPAWGERAAGELADGSLAEPRAVPSGPTPTP